MADSTAANPVVQSDETTQLLSAVKQTVQDTVSEAIKPHVDRLTQRADETDKKLDAISQPRSGFGADPNKLFGGAPGIRKGANTMSSRGYSYARAMAAVAGLIEMNQAPDECAVSSRLAKLSWDMLDNRRGTMLVPMGYRHLSIQECDAELAEEISQMTAQSVRGADLGQIKSLASRLGGRDAATRHAMNTIVQTLSTTDVTAGGALVDLPTTLDLIELQRAMEVFSRAGATELTFTPQGRIRFPRQTGASTAYWVGERQAITESEPTTGDLTLLAKKAATLVKSPNELLRFANPSWEAFLRADMARVLSLFIDRTCIDGVGSAVSIKGLVNYAITDKTGASGYVTQGSNGDTLSAVGPGNLLADIETANHDPEAASYIMRPKKWRAILNKRAGLNSNDSNGPFLFAVNREDISRGMPATLEGTPVVKSSQVPNNRVKNSGTDLTLLLCGVFQHWLIARAGVMEFATTDKGDTAFTQDETWVRVIQHVDAGPRYLDAFAMIDDIIET